MPVTIEEVQLFIRANIKTICGEKDVARHFGKSVETIRKAFSRNGEVNLSHFISDVRLETMQRLLVETDLPCKVICFESGFWREDTGHKFFKRMTRMTMTEYRKKTPRPKTQDPKPKTQNRYRRNRPLVATTTEPAWARHHGCKADRKCQPFLPTENAKRLLLRMRARMA